MSTARLLLIALFSSMPMVTSGAVQDCHVGFYRLADGSGVDIAPRESDSLRWRMTDGTTGELHRGAGDAWTSSLGWTGRPDGKQVTFADCAVGTMTFDRHAAVRVQFLTQDATFRSGDAELAGRLVLPQGDGTVPIVVLVHGSENQSARDFYADQRLFPSLGVGVFVYDKRGTGDSAGVFTHDYQELAQDAVAAVAAARKLAGARAGRVGFYGTSQGGWVAPLAATQTRVDFVIVGYGLAVSPMAEDTEAVEFDMRRAGFGAAETAQALEVARAAQQIVIEGFGDGYAALYAKRERYSAEPWFKFLRGNVTHLMLELPEELLRSQGPVLFNGVQPFYDPLPVLRQLDTAQLWILAAQDIDAPIGETLRRLRALQKARKPISVVVFPDAEHGMYEFEADAQGARASTRRPADYLPLMVEFARGGKIRSRYGNAAVYR